MFLSILNSISKCSEYYPTKSSIYCGSSPAASIRVNSPIHSERTAEVKAVPAYTFSESTVLSLHALKLKFYICNHIFYGKEIFKQSPFPIWLIFTDKIRHKHRHYVLANVWIFFDSFSSSQKMK